MARQLLVVAALFFFAVVGMASAATDAPAADAGAADAPAAGGNDDVIGNTDGGSEPDAAPIGGPVSSETFPKETPATEGPTAAGGGASSAVSLHSFSFTSIGAVFAIFSGGFIF